MQQVEPYDMQQIIKTRSHLEQYGPGGRAWRRVTAGMYASAVSLAAEGRYLEAIARAQDIRCENYGRDDIVAFRVITDTRMITETR